MIYCNVFISKWCNNSTSVMLFEVQFRFKSHLLHLACRQVNDQGSSWYQVVPEKAVSSNGCSSSAVCVMRSNWINMCATECDLFQFNEILYTVVSSIQTTVAPTTESVAQCTVKSWSMGNQPSWKVHTLTAIGADHRHLSIIEIVWPAVSQTRQWCHLAN